ncbi:alkene reductase [Agrobacterium cavarae]|uniref:alkene reductase n=1 Tax=Agrobacterium cavarae TaxID=2528239 RepID=UPI003FD23791
MDQILQTPVRLGDIELAHRVVLAPLTRLRATEPGAVPTEMMIEYYKQRASKGGLLITEATQISARAKGIPAAPGLHTDEQQTAWKRVVDAVHAKGGKIMVQLWHTGRLSHSSHQADGAGPIGPSAIDVDNQTDAMGAAFISYPRETPRALEVHEIAQIVDDFRAAATRAMAIGFDGVEIHSANGYLLDQFLNERINQRTDQYGGNIANRCRLTLEVTDAVAGVYGAGRVSVRLSPFGTLNGVSDSDPEALHRHLVGELSSRGLAFLHLIEPRVMTGLQEEQDLSKPASVTRMLRDTYDGSIISSGGFTRDSAEAVVREGLVDAIAFGREFIANPDLPHRFAIGAPLNPYNRPTFYGGDERGYTDYPSLGDPELAA